jgi:hypothetical protein
MSVVELKFPLTAKKKKPPTESEAHLAFPGSISSRNNNQTEINIYTIQLHE